jgi:hypothetical protein
MNSAWRDGASRPFANRHRSEHVEVDPELRLDAGVTADHSESGRRTVASVIVDLPLRSFRHARQHGRRVADFAPI